MVALPTILVIDDDPDIRGDLQMLLEDQGYRVLTASNGQMGLERVTDDEPNLVIVDMMMPKMSGFVVLERLKQQTKRRIPVMMLTANGSDHQKSFAEFLGVDAYLNKPIATRQLLDKVYKLCPIPPAALKPTEIPSETAV